MIYKYLFSNKVRLNKKDKKGGFESDIFQLKIECVCYKMYCIQKVILIKNQKRIIQLEMLGVSDVVKMIFILMKRDKSWVQLCDVMYLCRLSEKFERQLWIKMKDKFGYQIIV